MLISSLIAKPVLTQNGQKDGYVLTVLLTKNRQKISCLVCADENEEEYCIPARAIISIGDAVIVSDSRQEEPAGEIVPLGLSAYTESGKALGVLCDIELTESGAYLILSEDDKRYPVSCARYNQAVIIRTEKKKPTKKSTPRKKAATAAAAPLPQKEKEPVKTNGLDRLNLLGRKTKTEVYDSEGNVLARTGERVTPEILSSARRQNKLLELTVSTLTNLNL